MNDERWIHELCAKNAVTDSKIILELIRNEFAETNEEAQDMLGLMVGDAKSHEQFVYMYIYDFSFCKKLMLRFTTIFFGPMFVYKILLEKGLYHVTVEDRNYYFMPE